MSFVEPPAPQSGQSITTAWGTDVKQDIDREHLIEATFNVMDPRFGAKGDGSTDDTAAIQSAINAAAAAYVSNGSPAVVTGTPGLVYKMTFSGPSASFNAVGSVQGAVQIKPGVFIRRMSFTVPDYAGSQVAAIIDDGVGFAYWGVQDCRFNGNSARNLTNEAIHEGIMFASASDVFIQRNQFQLFRQSPVFGVSHSSSPLMNNLRITDNKITLCLGGAIKLDKGATDFWIERNQIINNSGVVDGTYGGAEAILIDDTTGLNTRFYIRRNQVINWGPQVVVSSGSMFDVSGNYLSPTAGSCAAFSVEGGGTISFASISNNFINGSAAISAVEFGPANNILVAGNTFIGNYTGGNPPFINEIGTCTNCLYVDNNLGLGTGTGNDRIVLQSTSSGVVVRNNPGALVVQGSSQATIPGSITISVPASGSAVGALPFDRTFYITTSTGTTTMAIQSGPTVTLQASTAGQVVRVPAGKTVTPSYSAAPTWVVEAE